MANILMFDNFNYTIINTTENISFCFDRVNIDNTKSSDGENNTTVATVNVTGVVNNIFSYINNSPSEDITEETVEKKIS